MPSRSPYDGHADFYLLDVWARRAEMDPEEVAALRGEMSRRGLSVDEDGAGPYREPPPTVGDGPPCPVCAGPTVEGKVRIRRSAVVGALLQAPSAVGAHCYFSRNGGGDETIVFQHTDSPSALSCNGCGTVVIRGRFAG